jgi:hypothetical protein
MGRLDSDFISIGVEVPAIVAIFHDDLASEGRVSRKLDPGSRPIFEDDFDVPIYVRAMLELHKPLARVAYMARRLQRLTENCGQPVEVVLAEILLRTGNEGGGENQENGSRL